MRFQGAGLRYGMCGMVLTVVIVALAIVVHNLAGAGSPAPPGMVWVPTGEFTMGSNAAFARPGVPVQSMQKVPISLRCKIKDLDECTNRLPK